MKRKQKAYKTYDEEFRREAVRLAEAGVKPLTQIARELGIHLETLRGWRRRYGKAAGTENENGVVPSRRRTVGSGVRTRGSSRSVRS